MDLKILLPHLKDRMWIIVCLMIACFPVQSFADIFAQSVYGSRQDAVILFTDRCQADNAGELQVAVSQSGSRVKQGCYAINNRRNAIVKWDDGSIEELDWKIFGKKPLALSVAQKNENGFTLWVFISGNTTRGTPVCSINISNSNNKNIRNYL